MTKIIHVFDLKNKYITKGDKMCKEFVTDIRIKTKDINDMPDRAKDVLKYFKINELHSETPIVEILTKLGFKIYQSNLKPEGLSAYIAVNPEFKDIYESNKITCVHINNSIGHKRFALAHELAHYLFDFDESKSEYYYNTYFPKKDEDKEEEKRANKFAANLLMPKDLFINKFEEYKKIQVDIVSALARYFLVSQTAVTMRFNELNLDLNDNYVELYNE